MSKKTQSLSKKVRTWQLLSKKILEARFGVDTENQSSMRLEIF